MKKYLIITLLLSSSIYASNSGELNCLKKYDETTNESPIRDTSPTAIELSIDRNTLKKFLWDMQKLEKHFEIIIDENFEIKIGSKGYSDIKNAVFFEVKNNLGYLYQYSKKGVNYSCKQG